ncbi:MAG: hypothetical protein P4L53_14075 [Candidatus Obscuribacterales bacterium]|nr:hypothetical protein [Candidatus Obscuribacterales bacterium]
MQTQDIDYKFWLEELLHFVGAVFYTMGEYLAAFCYLLLLVFNILSGNLHQESVDDERQRLYEEQKRQRFWEEEEREQREFEERQRLYTLRFGNWQERHLAATTAEEREEAATARNLRGVQLEIRHQDGRTAVATANRLDQLKFDSDRSRKKIAQLYSEVDYFRHQERFSRHDDRHDPTRRIRDLEAEIAMLERTERQIQLDLQNVSW